MQKLTIGVLAATLTCGSGVLHSQQPSPPSTPPPNSQDVPQQQPGTNNPDLQQQRKPAPGKTPRQSPGATDSTPSTPDVPHQQPGTENPDVSKQRQSAPGTSTGAQQNTSKKKHKRKKDQAISQP